DAIFAIALPDAPGTAAAAIAQRFVASVTEALSEDFPEARIHAVPATQEERQPYLSAQALISDTGKQLLATLRAAK
ncbi:MAG: hypothetical protein JJ903_00005, partial [Spongiibacter sp.]